MSKRELTSTTLSTYLACIANWENESDANIDKIIAEHRALREVPSFDPSTAVNEVVGDIESTAKTLVEEIIIEEAEEILADSAAIAAFWSFGASLAVLIPAQAAVIIEGALIDKKSKELNEKIENADVNIAKKIDPKVKDYIVQWKDNNSLIAAVGGGELNLRNRRADLFQFMLHVECKEPLNAASFKKWAGVARKFYHSQEIEGVLDALDDLHLSDRSDEAIRNYWKAFKESVPETSFSYDLARDISILALSGAVSGAKDTIKEIARFEEIAIEEVEIGLWEAMTGVGKFFTVLGVGWALVDAFLDVLKIIDMLDRYKSLKKKLESDFKNNYIEYYKGVSDAADAYRKVKIKR